MNAWISSAVVSYHLLILCWWCCCWALVVGGMFSFSASSCCWAKRLIWSEICWMNEGGMIRWKRSRAVLHDDGGWVVDESGGMKAWGWTGVCWVLHPSFSSFNLISLSVSAALLSSSSPLTSSSSSWWSETSSLSSSRSHWLDEIHEQLVWTRVWS